MTERRPYSGAKWKKAWSAFHAATKRLKRMSDKEGHLFDCKVKLKINGAKRNG